MVSGVYIASVSDMGVQWLRLALSKGPNRVGVSLHLRMETDPVSEMSCFSSNYLKPGRWTKSENPVILCVIHHRQNPIESTLVAVEQLLQNNGAFFWNLKIVAPSKAF
jgi:hypothetical protein